MHVTRIIHGYFWASQAKNAGTPMAPKLRKNGKDGDSSDGVGEMTREEIQKIQKRNSDRLRILLKERNAEEERKKIKLQEKDNANHKSLDHLSL